jgi:hypothetical protein
MVVGGWGWGGLPDGVGVVSTQIQMHVVQNYQLPHPPLFSFFSFDFEFDFNETMWRSKNSPVHRSN